MSPNEIAVIVFGCTFGGAILGMLIAGRLPDHHLSSDSRDVVKMAVGTVATLSALVLGLLIASAKRSFQTRDSELRHFFANLILLDRQLVHYGPEAQEARELLKRYARYKLDATWKARASRSAEDPDGWMLLEDLQDRVRALTPASDAQRWLQSRALQISGDLAQTRWLLGLQTGSAIPAAFLVFLVFWLVAIFSSFGLLAPPNATVIAALFVCALSVSSAIFLIVEMDEPFEGLIQISSEPMRDALAHLR
ncbi:MAG TPA: hypothetical protein VKM54_08645 [Myxococcota bacterium]|nr:hypothetical protein [Myxococcota bacterium]